MSHYIIINIILFLIIIIYLYTNKKVFIEKFVHTTLSNNVKFSSDTRSKCFDCDNAMPLKSHGQRCFDCEKESMILG